MTPATSAAQNGWRKTFALTRATPRRRMAPAAALTNISAAGTGCSTPKITDRATAPAPALSVNSHAGAGGACEIATIASAAAGGANRPASSSSMTLAADATRSMSTPVGSAATWEISLPSSSSD